MKINRLFLLFIFTFLIVSVSASNISKIEVHLFWTEGCPHCEGEKEFLIELENKYPELEIYRLEVSKNSENRKLMFEFSDKLDAEVSGVPFTVVGSTYYFKGWMNKETTGKAIEDAILKIKNENHQEENNKIFLPIFGEIDVKTVSLPILTIIIAALDGFNPCAMWVLLFLITLLLGIEDRFKRWLFGGVFIGASAFVYFLIMIAWLNLFLYIGFVFWIRLLIGIVALGAGIYNLREYFTNIEGVCKVTGDTKRQKVFENLAKIVQEKHIIFALLGLIILAFAVNLVELVCSAGLPAVYTQVLALSGLSFWEYYGYILLYILIFMLDDLIIFVLAMKTLEITGISSKYSRWSHLIGGILIFVLGLLLIFKPEILMFG
ncbi:MAG: hypothetical protein WC356_04700 [Candidatus Micrarchaeia archaeon]